MFNISSVNKYLKENPSKKVVLIGGTFDLLHNGHVRLLNKAKKLGEILIVGIGSDEYVKKHKGEHRPIIAEEKRAEMLLGLKPVDVVFITDTDLYDVVLLKRINPHVLVFSSREKHKMAERRIRAKRLKEILKGLKVVFVNSGVKDISTTSIESKIKSSKK